MNDSKYQTQDEGDYVRSYYLNPTQLKMIPIFKCKQEECFEEFNSKKDVFEHFKIKHNKIFEP